MMWKQTASLAALLGSLAIAGCDTEPGALDPTPLRSTVSSSVSVQPSMVAAESVRDPSCPTLPPFVGSLSINVHADDDAPLSLSRVQMTFTDTTGATAPQVTLPAPVLTRQFGSTLVEARSQRTFPFTFPFGCTTRRTGTLVVVIVVSDNHNREVTTEARLSVR
jgi:hypothetical protein